MRYRHRRPDDAEPRDASRAAAETHRRFGDRRLRDPAAERPCAEPQAHAAALPREGLVHASASRPQTRHRHRGTAGERGCGECSLAGRFRCADLRLGPDQFADGRRFRIRKLIDDVTRASRAAVVDTSISRRRVARELTALIARRGKPGVIVRDNGTEFTSNAVLDRAEKMRVTWHGIAPGKPMQTGNGEAFNERGSGRPCLADRAHAS